VGAAWETGDGVREIGVPDAVEVEWKTVPRPSRLLQRFATQMSHPPLVATIVALVVTVEVEGPNLAK
jgi:hypothetical protein